VKLDDIRKLNPCYDPTRYLPEDWEGSVSDILRLDACPEKDRIWVAVRLLDEKTSRMFAVWRAREALSKVPNPDPRSMAACEVVERYAHGQATAEEMAAAAEAARAAWEAWEAARAAAAGAARAAWEAWEAAWAAAEAARAAAAGAAEAARAAAAGAAWDAADAFDAADRKKQIEKLLELKK
jgi:hypothetical protein